jgi:hypothetical protein
MGQSPAEEHRETAKAERGREKATAGDGAELHLTAESLALLLLLGNCGVFCGVNVGTGLGFRGFGYSLIVIPFPSARRRRTLDGWSRDCGIPVSSLNLQAVVAKLGMREERCHGGGKSLPRKSEARFSWRAIPWTASQAMIIEVSRQSESRAAVDDGIEYSQIPPA